MTRIFIKKPIEIEAFRFGFDSMPDWMAGNDDIAIVDSRDKAYVLIRTLEGTMRADEGDYIIKGIKGEIYPCKSDIFEESYSEVELLEPCNHVCRAK
jgi:hypothetical protein